MGLLAFLLLGLKAGKISLVHWNHWKLFSTPSPFLRGIVNGDLKTFQKYWKFQYSSLRTDSQVKQAEKENRLALLAKHSFSWRRKTAWSLYTMFWCHPWPSTHLQLSCNTYVNNMSLRQQDLSNYNATFKLKCISFNNICMHVEYIRGTQQGYSSKPLNT